MKMNIIAFLQENTDQKIKNFNIRKSVKVLSFDENDFANSYLNFS